VRVSQEWDEVVHEVRLMRERLDAFRDDLLAAIAGGKLTGRQREFARDSTALASWCSLCLLELDVRATSETAEEGDTQE
jgi:hypothetical protein